MRLRGVHTMQAIHDVVWPYVELEEAQRNAKRGKNEEKTADASWQDLVAAAERLRYRGARHDWGLWLAHSCARPVAPKALHRNLSTIT